MGKCASRHDCEKSTLLARIAELEDDNEWLWKGNSEWQSMWRQTNDELHAMKLRFAIIKKWTDAMTSDELPEEVQLALLGGG